MVWYALATSMSLLVDVVLNHEREVLDLLFFKTFLVDGLATDLARQNLEAHVVIPLQHQLHLVKDEVDLLSVLERSISLDLDLLDGQGSLVGLAVLLQHFDQPSRAVGILSFQEHLALTSLSQRLQEGELVLPGRQLGKESVNAEVYHVNCRLLSLATALAKHEEPLPHAGVFLPIKGSPELNQVLKEERLTILQQTSASLAWSLA
jgi:hypothetical protein